MWLALHAYFFAYRRKRIVYLYIFHVRSHSLSAKLNYIVAKFNFTVAKFNLMLVKFNLIEHRLGPLLLE